MSMFCIIYVKNVININYVFYICRLFTNNGFKI